MTTPIADQDAQDLRRGGAANLTGTLVRALKPVSLAVIANLYGGEIFGQFMLCYAALDLLTGAAVFGADHALWNFVSRRRAAARPDLEAQALRTALLWTVAASGLLAAGTALSAGLLATTVFGAPALAPALRIIAPAIPAFALARVLLAATRGLRLMRYHVLVLDVGESVLVLVLAPALYLAGLTERGAVLALLLTAVAVLAAAALAFLRHFSPRDISRRRGAAFVSGEVLRYNLTLGWALVAGLLTRRLDVFLIAHFQPMSVVGAYTLASEFGGALGKIRSSFSPVVIPVLAARRDRPTTGRRQPSALVALSVTALSLPLLYVFVVAGPAILALYRPEFVAAYGAMVAIAAAHALHGFMGFPGEALSVAGRPRHVAIWGSVQVVLVAALAWLLIPPLGMLGAALAAGGALLLSRLPLLLIARRVLQHSSLSAALGGLLLRTAATLGVGGAAALLLRDRWPIVGAAIAAVALAAYTWWVWRAGAERRPHPATRRGDALRLLLFAGEYPPRCTGAATYAGALADGLARRGHEVTVLTFGPRGGQPRASRAREVRLPAAGPRWLEPARMLLGAAACRLLAPRADVVLLASDLAQTIAGDCRAAASTPFVCTVYGSEVTKRHGSRALAARTAWRLRLGTLRRASRVVAISRYTRNLLVAGGLAPDRVTVLHPGVPDAWFDTPADRDAARRVRRDLGVGDDDVMLLTLARVVARKGHDRVLRALPRALEQQPALRYVVAGAGEDLPAVRRLAAELALGNRVIFAGEVPETLKLAYYDACDVFVMPSRHDGRRVEGFGISFVEAAARRRPSVGGDHGGVPEVIAHGETGYLVDPGDTEALAAVLATVAGNAALRRRIGEVAYVRASERFRESRMVQEVERVVREASGHRR